jgi:hypothetical protein
MDASVTDSNRRVRTRTHGGVAGVRGRPRPLCRSTALITRDSEWKSPPPANSTMLGAHRIPSDASGARITRDLRASLACAMDFAIWIGVNQSNDLRICAPTNTTAPRGVIRILCRPLATAVETVAGRVCLTLRGAKLARPKGGTLPPRNCASTNTNVTQGVMKPPAALNHGSCMARVAVAGLGLPSHRPGPLRAAHFFPQVRQSAYWQMRYTPRSFVLGPVDP